jgi:hypothetical protein
MHVLAGHPEDVLGLARGFIESIRVRSRDERIPRPVDHEERARRDATYVARGLEGKQEEGEAMAGQARPPRGDPVAPQRENVAHQAADVAAAVERDDGRRARIDASRDDHGGRAEA